MEGVCDARYGSGVYGYNTNTNASSNGVAGIGTTGVYGDTTASSGNWAGWFNGNVNITGSLTASAKNFRIDHPLDPARKYLVHSCVESNEMMNIYRGRVTLGNSGAAEVRLPSWFDAANRNVDYQLTCIGGAAPVYISREVHLNRFGIAGGKPGLSVCWEVTAARNDAYARNHPLATEEQKTGPAYGKYIDPTDFGKPKSLAIDNHPLPQVAALLGRAQVASIAHAGVR